MTARDPRAVIKQLLPTAVLDRALLSFPSLYATRVVNYETNLDRAKVEFLLDRLRAVSALPGDVVECGSSRGGSAALMAEELKAGGVRKTIFACDSYAGFDQAELRAEREAGLTAAPDDAFTSTSLDYVMDKFRALGLSDRITPVPGFFEQTLPTLKGNFCLAFIDCDLRASVEYCARELWPRLVPGGQMLVDDYNAEGWGGAALGVRDFLAIEPASLCSHGASSGMYWFARCP